MATPKLWHLPAGWAMVRIGYLRTRNPSAEEPNMKAIMVVVVGLAMGLLLAANSSSKTIYSWTDKDGVQRFSDHYPTENVENFKQFESQTIPSNSPGASDERRPSYDQMVRRASQDARRMEQQRKAEAAARAAEKKRLAEERRQAKIKAERSRLLQQIEAIKNRALSPTFPQGMKDAQIKKIQKRIDALENNPGADAPANNEKATESESR
jgi:hypothetical protein